MTLPPRQEWSRRRAWPQALAISIAAGLAVAILGTMPLMGLPGALLLMPAEPIIRLLARGDNLYPHDSAWPFALALTWLLGATLPPAWMATRRLRGAKRGAVFMLAWAALGTSGTIALYWYALA